MEANKREIVRMIQNIASCVWWRLVRLDWKLLERSERDKIESCNWNVRTTCLGIIWGLVTQQLVFSNFATLVFVFFSSIVVVAIAIVESIKLAQLSYLLNYHYSSEIS